jgi:Domain of unknown function (DUF4293)
MIQRIQSVYLLLVTVLMSLMIFFPLASLGLHDGQSVVFYSYGVNKYIFQGNAEMITRTLPVLLLVCLTGIISFVNIFQFRRRVIQMRICLVNILLLALLLFGILLYYYIVKNSLPVENHIMKLPGIFPVVGIILTLLAYRNIHEDEILVQSYDHLR